MEINSNLNFKPSIGQPHFLSEEMIKKLTPEAHESLKEQTDADVYQIIINNHEGDIHMGNKEINHSFNNSNLENVNIQSEILQEYGLSEEDLNSLENDIELNFNDQITREQNLEFFDQFKKALEDHDKARAEKYLTWIKNGIGGVASVMTIGSTLGFF